MSAREWQPGDVAAITYGSGEFTDTAIRCDPDGWEVAAGNVADWKVTKARPLVVIDPENNEHLDRLVALKYYGHLLGRTMVRTVLLEIANPQPPKPDEIGLLVEFHADGRQYFVADCHRGRFMEAATDKHRLSLAELVVESGKVVKNRNGVQS